MTLICVFKTDDGGLLPLAQIALESAGIAYEVRGPAKTDSLRWMMGQKPTIIPTVAEIFVASDVAAQAKDLLADLDRSSTLAASDPALLTGTAETQAIQLEAAGRAIATITEAQLQELSGHLEETDQQQFLVDEDGIERLRHSTAEPALVEKLIQALGDESSITVTWTVGQ